MVLQLILLFVFLQLQTLASAGLLVLLYLFLSKICKVEVSSIQAYLHRHTFLKLAVLIIGSDLLALPISLKGRQLVIQLFQLDESQAYVIIAVLLVILPCILKFCTIIHMLKQKEKEVDD